MAWREIVGRAGWLLVVYAGLAWPAAAFGDRLILPAGEERDGWRVPAQLAGLDLGEGEGGTRIVVEADGSGWVLRAIGVDGTIRTATVDVPRTASQREDVAFLARSLARTMTAGSAPTPVQTLAPPPPLPPAPAPPPRPKPAPAPVVVAEPAIAPISVEPAPMETPAPLPPPPREARPSPLEDLDPLPSPVPRRKRSRTRGPVDLPPLQHRTPAVFRPDVAPALGATFGLDFARIGTTRIGWDIGFVPMHDIRLPLARRFSAVEATFHAMSPVGRWMRVGPVAGVSYRAYRQQFQPVGTGAIPFVALQAEAAVTVHRWSFGPDVRGAFDLVRTELVLPTGRTDDLAPFELQLGGMIRFAGTRDPFASDPTSSGVEGR